MAANTRGTGKKNKGDKSERLTDEQNEICYTVKLELMRAILEINQDDLWRVIKRAIDKTQKKSKESEGTT